MLSRLGHRSHTAGFWSVLVISFVVVVILALVILFPRCEHVTINFQFGLALVMWLFFDL